jgi:hypothetical protein
LGQQDEGGTLGLAARLRAPGLRAAALFGIALGADATSHKKPAAAPSK